MFSQISILWRITNYLVEKKNAALPLKSRITPGGCILTAGLGFSLAGSKCLGGGPELGSIATCCFLPLLLFTNSRTFVWWFGELVISGFWAWPINPLVCHTPLLIASGGGLEGEWLPTLEPPWPESRTSLDMDGTLNFDSYSLGGSDNLTNFTPTKQWSWYKKSI